MPGGDDLEVVLAFVCIGASLLIAGAQERRWKRRAFIALGLFFLLCAAQWDTIKSSYPSISELIVRAATHPASWVSGFFLIATVWVIRRFVTNIVHTETQREIDREALAAEAEALAHNISSLVTEYSGRLHVAWEKDTDGYSANKRSESRIAYTHHQADVRSQAMEKFGEKRYGADVLRILHMAAKCITLDYNSIWQLGALVSDYRSIETLPTLLTKIAVELRYSQPDLPMEGAPPRLRATSPPAAIPPSPMPQSSPKEK